MVAADSSYAETRPVTHALTLAGQPVRVEVITTLEAAEPIWRTLERRESIYTPYQRFDLLAAWQRYVGAASGVELFAVVGFDSSEQPLFLWPLGLTTKWPLRTLHFLGAKHSSFNSGLWRRDAAGSITHQELHAIFRRVTADHRVDLLTFHRQPLTWDGVANPFTMLAHQPSEPCIRLDFDEAGEVRTAVVAQAAKSHNLRAKERKLAKLPGYRYFVASTEDEVSRVLSSFFADKAKHLAAQGLTDVFAEPGVPEFIREACMRQLAAGTPPIELHAIESSEEVLALFAGSSDGRRFSCMFNTYTLGPQSRNSPGLVLLVNIVANCADRGFRVFDLGVGQASYKTLFCRDPEPLVDSFVAVSPLGHLAANATGLAFEAKRRIKESPALWGIVQSFRRLRAQRSEKPSGTNSGEAA